MATFLVFRELPGVTRDQYSAAQGAVADAIEKSAGRHWVRYRGGFFLAGRGRAICVFEADAATDVTDVNERAGVPFTDVVEATDLRPAEPRPGARTSSRRRNPPC